MLRAVNLDNEPRGHARKVDNVWSDDDLPSEMTADDWMSA
jgi:hypothetical protein